MGRPRKHPFICSTRVKRDPPKGWTPKRVGKIVCASRNAGYTIEALRLEIDKCAPCEKSRRRQKVTAEMVRVAHEYDQLMVSVSASLQVIKVAVDATILLSRLFPALRAPGVGLAIARGEIVKQMEQLEFRMKIHSGFVRAIDKEFAESIGAGA